MKVSYIMQSYIKNESKKSFIRSVKSFINQTNKDSELVIVADGCRLTYDLYYSNFKKESRIKFIYLDKEDSEIMYSSTSNGTYYRGLPRQVGRSIVTGEITAYLDSDDFLLPDATNIIKNNFEEAISLNPSNLWVITSKWIVNKNDKKSIPMFFNKSKNAFKIKELEGEYVYIYSDEISIVRSSTCTISHLSKCTASWKDTIDANEDTTFCRMLYSEGDGSVSKIPYYVIC